MSHTPRPSLTQKLVGLGDRASVEPRISNAAWGQRGGVRGEAQGPGGGACELGPPPGEARPFGGHRGGTGVEPLGPGAECDSVGLGWRGGGGGKAAAGWESGLVSCLEGKGPAEGSGGSAARHTPAFLPPSPPFCWKSKVIVNPGWGGLDEGPKLEEVALGVGPR